ncbi:phosphopantetheine-binding protein [Micromonospora haikouensis]|uniref:acyl carrier protein n=1 Tax=Micromonospora haikouensis TaxID=686309 RepID=UPI0037877F0A
MWDARFEEAVRARIPMLPPGQALGPDDELRALGMDSVATVALAADLESAYGIAFELDDLVPENFRTPARIWELISACRARVSAGRP